MLPELPRGGERKSGRAAHMVKRGGERESGRAAGAHGEAAAIELLLRQLLLLEVAFLREHAVHIALRSLLPVQHLRATRTASRGRRPMATAASKACARMRVRTSTTFSMYISHCAVSLRLHTCTACDWHAAAAGGPYRDPVRQLQR